MAVFDSEDIVLSLQPDFRQMATLPSRGVIATAPGKNSDFVSRFFAPQAGIDEDPVTGSAHCALAPYWSKRLGKQNLSAIQRSRRGGHLRCRTSDKRVHISGHVKLFLRGKIELPKTAVD